MREQLDADEMTGTAVIHSVGRVTLTAGGCRLLLCCCVLLVAPQTTTRLRGADRSGTGASCSPHGTTRTRTGAGLGRAVIA